MEEDDDMVGTIGVRGERIRVGVRWTSTDDLVGQLVCDEHFEQGATLPLVLDSGYRYQAIVVDGDNRFRAFERHG